MWLCTDSWLVCSGLLPHLFPASLHITGSVCVFGERFTPASCVLQDLVTPGSVQERHRWGAGRQEWGALGCFSPVLCLGWHLQQGCVATSLTLALQGPASRVQLLTDESGSGHHPRVAVTSCHLWLLLNLSIVCVTTSLNYTSSLLMLGVNLVLLVRPWLIQLPTSLQVKEPPASMAGWDSLGSNFTLLGRKILPIASDKVTSPKWTTMRQMLSVICLIYVIFWPLRELRNSLQRDLLMWRNHDQKQQLHPCFHGPEHPRRIKQDEAEMRQWRLTHTEGI